MGFYFYFESVPTPLIDDTTVDLRSSFTLDSLQGVKIGGKYLGPYYNIVNIYKHKYTIYTIYTHNIYNVYYKYTQHI